MVSVDQVFLPYMLIGGETVYDLTPATTGPRQRRVITVDALRAGEIARRYHEAGWASARPARRRQEPAADGQPGYGGV